MNSRREVDVTVIIPTYNRLEYLVEAIESVLLQTVIVKEIIVVDDGSTDKTAEVVRAYGNNICYVYQENQGVSAARNHGIQLATSKYIAFLDSDDRWMRGKIENQVKIMEADLRLVAHVCNISWYKKTGIDLQSFWVNSIHHNDAEEGVLTDPLAWVINDSIAVIQAIMVRADIVQISGVFNEKLSLWEDTDFAARVALCGLWAFSVHPGVLIRDLNEGEDRLSRVRESNVDYSLNAKIEVLKNLLKTPCLNNANDRKIVLYELAKSLYALGGSKARVGKIKEAGQCYIKAFHHGLRLKSFFMLVILCASLGMAHRILWQYKSRKIN